VEVLSIKSRL